MCIAGVFGGLDSGVTEGTKERIHRKRIFQSHRVRRTARRHGLSTDASFRYERGADPSVTVYAARLAASLIKELAGEKSAECNRCSARPIERKRTRFLPYILQQTYRQGTSG